MLPGCRAHLPLEAQAPNRQSFSTRAIRQTGLGLDDQALSSDRFRL